MLRERIRHPDHIAKEMDGSLKAFYFVQHGLSLEPNGEQLCGKFLVVLRNIFTSPDPERMFDSMIAGADTHCLPSGYHCLFPC
jgi:hypothetical protein